MKLKNVFYALSVLLLTGCESNNIKSFRVDESLKHNCKYQDFQKVYLEKTEMKENDENSIVCRLNGNIYLPKKMTYSQYVHDAFQKTLMTLGAYTNSRDVAKNNLKILPTEISFSSVKGEWYIKSMVQINRKNVASIESTTEFGTAYSAFQACRNTADSFDEAVADFIEKVLTHPEIIKHLKK